MADLLDANQLQEKLAEGDRWIELRRGRLVRLEQPDTCHLTVVHHFAKLLATATRQHRRMMAAFDLGLNLEQDPDSVLFPAISCYAGMDHFDKAGLLLTDSVPDWIIEVASSSDRRNSIAERIAIYHRRGVKGVWVADTVSSHIHILPLGEQGQMLKPSETLRGEGILAGIETPVGNLFQNPWSE